MYLGGGYKFGNYDYYGKGRYSKSLGKQTAGRETIINTINVDDVDDVDSEEYSYDELDDFVNDLTGDIGSKIKRKATMSLPMTTSDPYAFKNKDRAAGQLKNTGGNMFEYAGDHKNYARKGISPYKQPKHSGPPLGGGGSSQAFRTSGNFVGIGTQYGSSRPHKLLTDVEDDNVFNLSDIEDPMEKAFSKQQNKIKKVLSVIKEYLL